MSLASRLLVCGLFLLVLGVISPLTVGAQTPPADLPQPVNIILDSDIGSDINDAMVYDTLNALVQKGEAKLLAIVLSVDNDYSAPTAKAFEARWGHPVTEIPIGAYQGNANHKVSPFTQQVAAQFGDPNDKRANYPDPLTIYRHTLAMAPDHSVVILSVGFLTNLSQLLQSPADSLSPLSGSQLVNQKVRRLVMMGGDYPYSSKPEHNFAYDLTVDPEAAANVMTNWPTEIVTTGYSFGDPVCTRPTANRDPATDPLAKVWSLTSNIQICPLEQAPITNGMRPSWDTLTTLYAIRGLSTYFSTKDASGNSTVNGVNSVNQVTGSNVWSNAGGGQVTYLGKTATDSALATVLDTLVDTVPTPPSPTPTPPTDSACTFDTRVYYADPSIDQETIDRVTIGNTQYTRLASIGWSADKLSDWDNYTVDPNSPCFGKTADQCRFTTRVDYVNGSNILNESLTIGPSYYDWVAGTGWRSSTHDLAGVARYRLNADAPCYNTNPGTCSFTSRYVLYRTGTSLYDEFITVGPKYYQYASDTGWLSLPDHDLTTNSHYKENASAPCFGKAVQTCIFTNLTRYYDKNGNLSEFVEVGNRFYSWTETTGWWTPAENRLGYTGRYLETNGPCLATTPPPSPAPTATPNPTLTPIPPPATATPTPLPKDGDLNLDHFIDWKDFLLFLPHFSLTAVNFTIGDHNHNGIIDIFDYSAILKNFAH